MNTNLYEFSREDAFRFVRVIGTKAKDKGTELELERCPYCGGGQHKDRGTFSINLTTGQFECKRSSCSVKGNMITLAKDFRDRGFNLPKDAEIYYNIGGQKEKFKEFKDAHRQIEVRDPAVKYLMSRGIPEEIIRKYEVTSMPDQENIIVFPFKDESGAFQFAKYRNINFQKGDKGSKEWCMKDTENEIHKKILFGMAQCEDFSTLVMTEGQIDSLSLAAAGIKNAVSVPTGKNGFTWVPNCWDWLLKFEEIVIFGDNEKGEITLAKEITQRYPKRVRVVRVEDYKGHKDANEILQKCGTEALLAAVENAKPVVSFRIKNLADVQSVDLNQMESFPTYLPSLDKAIGRGFHMGEVIILTGKCGEGKSTFASQIVGRMIQNGLKCFCYSGELPDYMFKAWFDKQISGQKDVPEGKRNQLNEWYSEKCYIYDNSSVIDEKEELFDLMGQAVRDLGCKFFLIDNLMTAMEDRPQEDLFRQQSNFLNRLTKFAKGYEVIILLVVHPKKGDSVENDSISGSGDITNRANLVLRYQRKSKKPEDENISKILITKNRTTGRLNWDGIMVEYFPDTMRIRELHEKSDTEFIEKNDGFIQVEEDELSSIPF